MSVVKTVTDFINYIGGSWNGPAPVTLIDTSGNPYNASGGGTTQPVSGAVNIADGVTTTQRATVAQFHNSDNQNPGATGYGILTGGVAQLLNSGGNLDRQRETGQDGISAQGIATGTQQLASPFTTTSGTNAITLGASPQAITPAAMSGTSRGAAWSIQIGTVLSIDTGANRETIVVTASTSTTFSAVFTKNHSASVTVLGYVYNQARDATTADGSTGQGFAAGATYLYNSQLNSGNGGWESERSANGEQDNATGTGTAVAVGYEFNGSTYDRERNVQGKGLGSGTVSSGGTTGSTSVTPVAVPTGLQPGSPVYFSGGTGVLEVAYTTSAYVAGTSPILLQSGLVGNNRTTIQWDIYVALGPQLNGILPSGIGLEEDVVFDPVSNLFYLERSATQDAVSGQNLPMESVGLYNGTNFDRWKGTNGAAYVAGAYTEQASLSASALNADLITSIDVSAYKWVSLQVGGTFTGTITVQGCNDNSNFLPINCYLINNAIGLTTTVNSGNIVAIPVSFRYLRVRMTAYTSGNATGVAEFYTTISQILSMGVQAQQYGTWTVQPGNTQNTAPWLVTSTGNVASLSTDTGNPVKTGGVYSSTLPTPSSGQRVDKQVDNRGIDLVNLAYQLGYLIDSVTSYPFGHSYTAISTAATTTIKSGAGVCRKMIVLGGTLGNVTVYDNTTASGTTIVPTVTPIANGLLIEDCAFGTGLTVVTAAATVIVAYWR